MMIWAMLYLFWLGVAIALAWPNHPRELAIMLLGLCVLLVLDLIKMKENDNNATSN